MTDVLLIDSKVYVTTATGAKNRPVNLRLAIVPAVTFFRR
jgi:hypothetical protein